MAAKKPFPLSHTIADVPAQRAVRQLEKLSLEYADSIDALSTQVSTLTTTVGAGSGVTSVTAGSSKVTVTPTTGAVVVDVVPANLSGIPESGITNLTTDLAGKQPLDATLTALAGISGTGLVEETGVDTFAIRAIGVGASTSIPTRADGDTRWAAASHTHPESDITSLVSDLAAKAPTTRTISTTSPLSGGGDLSADRTLSISTNGIDNTLIRQSAGLSVVGRSANSTGNVADITAANDGDVLRRSGTTLGFGSIPESSVTNLTTDLAAKVPTSRTLTGTAPIRIDGGASADLSANRTISINTYAGSSAGAVPAGAGSTIKFLREDAAWANPIVNSLWSFLVSDGRDGALTFDGSSTVTLNNGDTIVPSANVYTLARDIFPSDMTVNNGVTIKVAGFRILGSGTLTNNGTIHANGVGGSNASGTTGGTKGTGAVAGSIGGGTDGGNGANASSGGGGATGHTSTQGPAIYTSTNSTSNAGAATGGPGGTGQVTFKGGGGGASTLSGGVGGSTSVSAATAGGPDFFAFDGGFLRGSTSAKFQFGTGGGGGGANANAAGGGGGGGGGMVLICFPTITGTGTISANGGNGGNGAATSGSGGGGGGGGGGFVLLAYWTKSGQTVTVTGGTKGSGANGGGTGGDGASGATRNINLSGDGT